jgi:uncharacterized membrane protein
MSCRALSCAYHGVRADSLFILLMFNGFMVLIMKKIYKGIHLRPMLFYWITPLNVGGLYICAYKMDVGIYSRLN